VGTGEVHPTLADFEAGGAPLGGPHFDGEPEANTTPRGYNSRRLATTEFIQRAIDLVRDDSVWINGRTVVLTLTNVTQMTAIGYMRACRFDPDLEMQELALRAWGAEVVRVERGGEEGREELKAILRSISAPDVLLVTRIDRLARGIAHLRNVMRVLRARGISLVVTEQPVVTERAFLEVVEAFAEFEANLRRERLLNGVAKGKARGRYRGRLEGIDHARFASCAAAV
jgi:hypothetical protein